MKSVPGQPWWPSRSSVRRGPGDRHPNVQLHSAGPHTNSQVNSFLNNFLTIATVLDFLPPKDKFDTIVLFIGGNNAFNNQTPSTPPPREIARELSHLANRLLELARKVVILGIPFRKGENNHNRARAINIEIENLTSENSWNFRGIAAKTFEDSYLQPDGVHLTPTEGLQPVRSALKKLLYKEFSKSANSAGHKSDLDCPSDKPCRCSYFTLPRRR